MLVIPTVLHSHVCAFRVTMETSARMVSYSQKDKYLCVS